MNDLVTVYIPTKNRVDLLRRAIASVLGQLTRDIELIVVSDGSEDGTCDYVRALKSDIKITLIHNEKSVGSCEARNQAVRAANGKYITGLDDDDIFMPHRIESFLQHWRKLEEAGEAFSCLFDRRIVNNGWGVALWDTDSIATSDSVRVYNAMGNQVFTTPQRMIEAGLFDSAMPAWQDWDMWVRLVDRFGPAKSISTNTYIMDTSHELERITNKSPEKILQAAVMFHNKHCHMSSSSGVLRSLAAYEQVSLTMSDLLVLAVSGKYKIALGLIKRGKFKFSMAKSVPIAAAR